jgi:hypothetical protein
MHELVVGDLQQAPRLGVEFQGISLSIKHSHPLEQLLVEADGIGMRRKLGRQCGPGRLQCGIDIGLRNAEENSGRAGQKTTAALHRHQGVIECRCRRIGRNLADLLQLLGHAGLECRLIVLVFDLVESRRMKRQ